MKEEKKFIDYLSVGRCAGKQGLKCVMATWEHKYPNSKYPPFLLLHPALIGEQCHLYRTPLHILGY